MKGFRIRLRIDYICLGSSNTTRTCSVGELLPGAATQSAHGAASRLCIGVFTRLTSLSMALEPIPELLVVSWGSLSRLLFNLTLGRLRT